MKRAMTPLLTGLALSMAALTAPAQASDRLIFDQIQVNSGADWSAFNKVHIAPIAFDIPEDRPISRERLIDVDLDERDRRRLSKSLEGALKRRLDDDWEITGRADDETLVVTVTLTRVTPNVRIQAGGARSAGSNRVEGIGGATMALTVTAGEGGRLVLRANDSYDGPNLNSSQRGVSEFADAQDAFRYWARDLNKAMQSASGRSGDS